MKMGVKAIKSEDTEIEEYEFHEQKAPVSINDIDINSSIKEISFW